MSQKPRVCGIICEFNPLHKGHVSLLKAARENGADFLIAVMSGNFVQRGGPAMFSKWARAEMALACGIDLVLELPLPWAMAGAERFALGGVSLLDSLSCVDFLAFGSESGDSMALRRAAHAVLSPALAAETRRRLKAGCTFAQAREQAALSVCGEETAKLLRSPNDILAVEYCKAIETLGSPIVPFTIRRTGAGHDQNTADPAAHASSSQIRALLAEGQEFSHWMAPEAAEIARRELEAGLAPVTDRSLEQAVLARLRTMDPAEFAALPDVSEGLENRFFQAVRTAASLEELWFSVKTKRYPLARIRRLVYSAFLGIPGKMEGYPPYARILGFRRGAEELLSLIRKNARIPIVSTAAEMKRLNGTAREILDLEAQASDLYALGQPRVQPCGMDFTRKLLITETTDARFSGDI